jgi:hypothetical protein
MKFGRRGNKEKAKSKFTKIANLKIFTSSIFFLPKSTRDCLIM